MEEAFHLVKRWLRYVQSNIACSFIEEVALQSYWICLSFLQAPIQLQGRTGIALQGLPQITSAGRTDGSQYHLCACSSGKLFRVPANPRRCAAANGPCS